MKHLILSSVMAFAISMNAQESPTYNITAKSVPNSAKTNPKLALGKQIESFVFTDMNGKNYSLTDLKGKVVVLNFWFTTCVPCIEEVDEFNRVAEMYKDSNVVILSPTFDSKAAVEKFLLKYPMKTTVCPAAKEYTNKFELIYYPTNVIIDKEGFIFKSYTGSTPDIEKHLIEEISFLLRI